MTKPLPHRPQIDMDWCEMNTVREALKVISRAHAKRRVLYDVHKIDREKDDQAYTHVAQRLDHPALDHLFTQLMSDLTNDLRSEIAGFEYAVLSNLSACRPSPERDVPILADLDAVRDPFTLNIEAKLSVKRLLAEMAVAHARAEVQEAWRTNGREDENGWAFFDDFIASMVNAFNTMTMTPQRFGDFGGYLLSTKNGKRWLPELKDGQFDLILVQNFTVDQIKASRLSGP